MDIPKIEMERIKAHAILVGGSARKNKDGTLTVTFGDGNFVTFSGPYSPDIVDFIITGIVNYVLGQE